MLYDEVDRLMRAASFEQVLETRYLGNKRFSLEGLETLIPVLAEMLQSAIEKEAVKAVLAMSHRGRLNVMAHIVGKPYTDLLAGFEDVDPRSIMGAGDVKLLGAVGAWLGPMGVLYAGLYSVLAGGILALIVGGMHGYLGKAFSNLRGLLGFWRAAGIRPLPGLTIDDSAGPRLAYGVAIATGTVAAVWLK